MKWMESSKLVENLAGFLVQDFILYVWMQGSLLKYFDILTLCPKFTPSGSRDTWGNVKGLIVFVAFPFS